MKKIMASTVMGALFLGLCGFAPAEVNNLRVEVSNFDTDGAKRIQVSVFSKNNFLEKSIQTKSVVVSGGKATVEFDLPPGEYAVSTFQDVNSNNELDRYFFGKPKEPYGFSNNVKSLGPPAYDKCKIQVGASVKTISIKLIN